VTWLATRLANTTADAGFSVSQAIREISPSRAKIAANLSIKQS
jgi:hypothetical protein